MLPGLRPDMLARPSLPPSPSTRLTPRLPLLICPSAFLGLGRPPLCLSCFHIPRQSAPYCCNRPPCHRCSRLPCPPPDSYFRSSHLPWISCFITFIFIVASSGERKQQLVLCRKGKKRHTTIKNISPCVRCHPRRSRPAPLRLLLHLTQPKGAVSPIS